MRRRRDGPTEDAGGDGRSGQAAGKKPDATIPLSAHALPDQEAEWRIRAYLAQTISSAREKPGDSFEAVVAEPVFGAGHALAVPQGSLLIGTITQAKPARSFLGARESFASPFVN